MGSIFGKIGDKKEDAQKLKEASKLTPNPETPDTKKEAKKVAGAKTAEAKKKAAEAVKKAKEKKEAKGYPFVIFGHKIIKRTEEGKTVFIDSKTKKKIPDLAKWILDLG